MAVAIRNFVLAAISVVLATASHALGAESATVHLPEITSVSASSQTSLNDNSPILENQIWLISSRSIACPTMCDTLSPNLQAWQYLQGCWVPSSIDEFLASDQQLALPTSFYIHGNNVESADARSTGLTIYRQLVKCHPQQPLRFVIWSWPSEKGPGLLRDLRAKADRANTEGFYVAWVLNRMVPSTSVTLMGYSYGARVTTGALHVLGGGRVAGLSLAGHHDLSGTFASETRLPVNAVLFAAAVDHDSLLPGRSHGQALTQINKLVIFTNPCDRVLKRYRFLTPYRPTALGSVGLPRVGSLFAYWPQIEQVRLCSHQHDWRTYWYSPQVLQTIRNLPEVAAGPEPVVFSSKGGV